MYKRDQQKGKPKNLSRWQLINPKWPFDRVILENETPVYMFDLCVLSVYIFVYNKCMVKYFYGTLAFEVNICFERALDLYLLYGITKKGKWTIGIFVSIKY